ncbi:hypothetical protein QBC39DRAFT_339715 [Podospora conica]|nr:hypothetical protein QBC39DRAFT_339715 [Schizothecium conicum]
MAEQLKRTFHGCLTCRKRKVRCLGGSPCQNCSRMNITCHSSFDTNLRIRVSTPNGQKTVDAKATPKREPRTPSSQPKPNTSSLSSINHQFVGQYDGHNKPFVPAFQPHFSSFSFAQQPATYTSEPPALQITPPSSVPATVANIDSLQFNGIWSGFDFPALDPELGRDFQPRLGIQHPTTLPSLFDNFLPGTPVSHTGYSISDSEGSTSSNNCQQTEGPKEWIPRRRKRTGKGAPSVDIRNRGSPATAAQPNEAELLNHFRSQNNLADEQEARWSFNSFVADFIQRCSPRCPMRLAVLAWTARDAASSRGETAEDPTVASWYERSTEQVEELFCFSDPTIELGTVLPVTNAGEVIISASFFLNRYDVLAGDLRSANNRMERMTRWLTEHSGNLNLSPFACKLLLWGCYLQIRIGIFSSEQPYFPTLMDAFNARADCHVILERSHSFHQDMFGHVYPRDRLSEDLERIPVSLHLHETFRLLNNILRYRAKQQGPSQSESGAPNILGWDEVVLIKHTVEQEIRRIQADYDIEVSVNPSASILRHGPISGMSFPTPAHRSSAAPFMSGMPTPPPATPPSLSSGGKINRVGLHWLSAYAAFMMTKILWSRLVRPDIRTDDESTAAVESILQITLLLRRSEGKKMHARLLPSCIWPLPLFVAGIESVDEVWADWVKLFISGMEGKISESSESSRGSQNVRMLALMEEVRSRQDVSGTRIGVADLMAEKGLTTAMFVF